MKRTRDFRTVVERLGTLSPDDWQVTALGEVWGYPFLVTRRLVDPDAPTILLTAGMHGEEPAGVEAVLCWLASDRWKSYHWNWLVVPCINPFGWERNRRTNAQRRDINRQFRKDQDDTPEASLIRRLIRKRQFTVSMEFHEDVDASGFYLYEARRDRAYLGEKVLAAVERVVPINQDPVIDGAERTAVGLIRRDLDGHEARRRRRWPMAYRLYLGHADNIYGSETTISEPLDDRAEAHQIALEVVLGS